jgi:NADPH-dependent 2,4-dienoyl-CoA reductase/sulfur reductase-like enzyme
MVVNVAADIAVIGAGPAGLAAAAAATRAGADVALIDAAPRPGGQFWRHRAHGIDRDADLHHDLATFARLQSDNSKKRLQEHHVWTLAATDEGCTVRALGPDQSETVIDAGFLILAPGACDRQIPFPGWDLPGVLTAGGAQALLKGNGVVAGQRVLVAGTGPFLLPVAAGLAARGATVVGVHEANHPAAWLRHPVGALGKLPEALGYLRVLRRHGVPVRYRSAVASVEGDGQAAVARVAPVTPNGSALLHQARPLPVDVVATGWGFTPQLELPLAAGCQTRVDGDGSLVVVVDDDQFTSHPRVLAAGEVTGIGGAALAVTEGTIAGIAAAARVTADARGEAGRGTASLGATGRSGSGPVPERELARLRRRRTRLRSFARTLQRVYPVPSGWPDSLPGDTIVCRCEEVTASQLREAVDLGADGARTAKLLSRAGMGWCQGRVCGYAASCLVSRWTGAPYDPSGVAERPVAVPLPLSALTDESPG